MLLSTFFRTLENSGIKPASDEIEAVLVSGKGEYSVETVNVKDFDVFVLDAEDAVKGNVVPERIYLSAESGSETIIATVEDVTSTTSCMDSKMRIIIDDFLRFLGLWRRAPHMEYFHERYSADSILSLKSWDDLRLLIRLMGQLHMIRNTRIYGFLYNCFFYRDKLLNVVCRFPESEMANNQVPVDNHNALLIALFNSMTGLYFKPDPVINKVDEKTSETVYTLTKEKQSKFEEVPKLYKSCLKICGDDVPGDTNGYVSNSFNVILWDFIILTLAGRSVYLKTISVYKNDTELHYEIRPKHSHYGPSYDIIVGYTSTKELTEFIEEYTFTSYIDIITLGISLDDSEVIQQMDVLSKYRVLVKVREECATPRKATISIGHTDSEGEFQALGHYVYFKPNIDVVFEHMRAPVLDLVKGGKVVCMRFSTPRRWYFYEEDNQRQSYRIGDFKEIFDILQKKEVMSVVLECYDKSRTFSSIYFHLSDLERQTRDFVVYKKSVISFPNLTKIVDEYGFNSIRLYGCVCLAGEDTYAELLSFLKHQLERKMIKTLAIDSLKVVETKRDESGNIVDQIKKTFSYGPEHTVVLEKLLESGCEVVIDNNILQKKDDGAFVLADADSSD